MPLVIDRLELLTNALAAELESVSDAEIHAHLNPTLAAGLRLVKRLARLDLIGEARATVTGSLRGFPAAADRDPAAADAILARILWAVAWLDGQVDDPPPLELLRPASPPVIASP